MTDELTDPEDRPLDIVLDAAALIAFGRRERAALDLVRDMAEDDAARIHVSALSVMMAFMALHDMHRREVDGLLRREQLVTVHSLDLRAAQQVGAYAGDGPPKPLAALHAVFIAVAVGCRIATGEAGLYEHLAAFIDKDRLFDLHSGWDNGNEAF